MITNSVRNAGGGQMLCKHGKFGRCLLCECEKIAKDTEEALKEVRQFIKQTNHEIDGQAHFYQVFKQYQAKKMMEELTVDKLIKDGGFYS